MFEVWGEVPAGLDLAPMERVVEQLLLRFDELPDGTINVSLVDRAASQDFNARYSGNDYPTDVLSFSYIEDGGEAIDGVVGEMAVCLPIAAEQAEAAGLSLADEVALLVLHGGLHILGHDHQTPEQQAEVSRLQRELMTAAGNRYREFAWTA